MGNLYLGEEFLKMRKKYASVFIAVLLFTLAAQAFIQYSIWMKTSHSEVINIAGRQRMLSQRIASLAMQSRSSHTNLELQAAHTLLVQSHERLSRGDDEMNLPPPFTSEIESLYLELDPIASRYKTEVECILSNCVRSEKAITSIAKLSEAWLPKMDNIVRLSENYASSQLVNLSIIEAFLFLAILCFMGFELFGVLMPYQKQVAIEKEMMVHPSQLATLGEMSAGIAHEINNPLAVIQSGALAIDFLELEDPRVADLTSKIKSSVGRVVKIVDALRKFSRKSNESEMVPCSLNTILSEVIVLTERKVTRHKIQFEVNMESDVEVKCDEVQMGQVFTNLVSNAIDANNSHPEPWVKISVEVEADVAKVVIRDSGKGIEAEVASKLFNPFFTTKPVQKGTGLGLSLSKGLVESNGGKIWYELRGGNTAFIVALPLSKTRKLEPNREDSGGSDSSTNKVG